MSQIENPSLLEKVESTNSLKEYVIEYVGKQLRPEDNGVTVEMVIDVFARDFPEFLLPIAEENFIRGYKQALIDVDVGMELAKGENNDKQENS
jgi:hypothetical protein